MPHSTFMPLQHRGDHFHVLGARAAHFDLAAGDRRDHGPTARFDVVAPQPVLRAVQRRAAFDPNRGRAGAGDADAQLLQEHAQLDDVRLAGGVADFADARARPPRPAAPSRCR